MVSLLSFPNQLDMLVQGEKLKDLILKFDLLIRIVMEVLVCNTKEKFCAQLHSCFLFQYQLLITIAKEYID